MAKRLRPRCRLSLELAVTHRAGGHDSSRVRNTGSDWARHTGLISDQLGDSPALRLPVPHIQESRPVLIQPSACAQQAPQRLGHLFCRVSVSIGWDQKRVSGFPCGIGQGVPGRPETKSLEKFPKQLGSSMKSGSDEPEVPCIPRAHAVN